MHALCDELQPRATDRKIRGLVGADNSRFGGGRAPDGAAFTPLSSACFSVNLWQNKPLAQVFTSGLAIKKEASNTAL
jgi:hypothetical protein